MCSVAKWLARLPAARSHVRISAAHAIKKTIPVKEVTPIQYTKNPKIFIHEKGSSNSYVYDRSIEAHLIFIYNRDREMFQAGIGVDLTSHQRQSGLFTYLHSYNCSSSNIHGDPKVGAGASQPAL